MGGDENISHLTFSMLESKVDSRILKSLKLMGFLKPTQIQAKALPHMLLGDDIIGAAKTGSGKTLAFLIPAVEKLINMEFSKKHGVGCLIITPTRELALQINVVLKKLLAEINLTHSLLVGGEKKLKEIASLRKGVNVIVGTPGRILDHLENTSGFNCNNLKCLVLDEADKLLEAGFQKHISGIIRRLPKKRQTVLFSATIDEKVENLARLALKDNPKLISVKDERQSTAAGLEQGYCICPVEKRLCWLYKMLKKCKKLKVMVFFSSCKSVDFHYEFFKVHCKAAVISIHGKQSQPRRKDAYQTFVQAKKGALFCTDVAARGLDIPSVNWIVQYDPPTDMKEYIHRVGRTARGLNSTGKAVILLREEEEKFVEYLKREKVYLDKYNFGETPDDVQKMLQDIIQKDGTMKILARKAYLSFLRCYKKHPHSEVFDIKNLDLKLAATAFGFSEQPHVDFLKTRKRKQTNVDATTAS
ncbi:jg5461 [Pararge aegeria aegeria]|uniref:ATP-dependent RNA helicase n=2 Tax=Pararge aegeria TaxID=116150 RepID=A0A8S4SDN7_9NEOP|nr:jg5461 [Pararge aegeria aegeria]